MSDDGRDHEPRSLEGEAGSGLRRRLRLRRRREPTFRERLLAHGFKEGNMKEGETRIMFGYKRIGPVDDAPSKHDGEAP